MTPSATPGPLGGLKVLDLSRFIAGPVCAQILADFGAEVVKIERPGGEDARHHEPYYRGESVYTMLYNRNKHGATLDTRHPSAAAILEDLVRWADVVVENYRPGTMERMGLGYERLTELHPEIILVSVSGFGQTGPMAQRALFDAISQASSGLMSITGEASGEPTLTGTYIADYVSGYQAAIGAFAALADKKETGKGQRVDVASLDSMFATLGTRLIAHLMLDLDMPRSGSRDLLTAPVNVYRARDGDVYIQAGTNGLFPKLCRSIGRTDLLEVPEYRTVPGRMADQETLEQAVADWAKTRTCAEIGDLLDEAGVPCAKVESVAEVAASPQIAAREMIAEVEHPDLGVLRLPGNPVKMDRSQPTTRKAPPRVGEDNEYVYRTILGRTEEELAELRDSGAL
ncbi:CoA transferase [Saccharopolyspora sp. HNM0986]|uniref:CaiB/BaiF CoA transferase family protein n=1 Tax=Saccharopolyspora galaxeae TaxID=2781241 RepID=UPI00190D7400|nr:CoA transferase [Saccharopolyspora sp. HNM0986]MBK0868923.1 CoA transferase [Saccharopolyspora sp. HNM0986]